MANTADGSGNPRPRRVLSRADNPLVRAVGRVPASVLAKLLVAFVAPLLLVVVVGVLGLRVIGESNDRIVTLGGLQQRASAYGELRTAVAGVLRVWKFRVPGASFLATGVEGILLLRRAGHLLDQLIASSVLAVDASINPARLGSVPPADEQSTLELIAQARRQLSEVMSRVIAIDRLGSDWGASDDLLFDEAEPLIRQLASLAASLATSAQDKVNTLIVENQRSFVASQNLFIGVAVASVILAMLLGYVLSWSITGPIRRMQTRLEGIASGDFADHVEVANRDELGALASNLNRMNDELGRLYDALETASRHKSEFLATMSHELRTPLNAIIGFSQVLKQQMFGELNAKQADYVDDVLSSGQHLLNLINDILDLAKVEAGRMELQPTTFAVPELLENAMSMVREQATRQGVGLSTGIDPSVGLLEGDERKLKQIIFNLLANGVKFTPSGGQVTLTASVLDEHLEISVRDTGVGLSAEDQVRIFEEFYQVGAAKTQEGTGLGLPLTRRLVELHHGRLSVESEPGLGSTFTVSLPLHQPEIAAESAPATDGESTR